MCFKSNCLAVIIVTIYEKIKRPLPPSPFSYSNYRVMLRWRSERREREGEKTIYEETREEKRRLD